MPTRIFRMFLPVIVFIFLFPLENYANSKVRTIVMFFAWNASIPAYQNILEGFYNSFSENNKHSCNILVEYLDINRLHSDSYAKNIVDLYNEKYKNTPIDLLILTGPSLYPVLKEFGLKAISTAPVISIDNEDLSGDTATIPSNLFRIVMSFNLDRTLKTVFDLFPEHKTVYVIGGMTQLDKYYSDRFRVSSASFENTHPFSYLLGESIDSVINFARQIPRNSIVFVPAYTMDRNNIAFTSAEGTSLVASNCEAPVFTISDTYLRKEGSLGGYLFSFVNVGREAGNAANQILSGNSLNNIKIDKETFYHYYFNWEGLKKWGVQNSGAIIPASTIYNYHQTFLEHYKWYIFAVLIFLISQSVLILYLIKLNRRQKMTALQKEETEYIYRELVREDRLLKMFELTASLAHELNQPLTAILYNAQAGKRFLQSDKPYVKQMEEIFNNIIEDDKRAGSIISSVRSLMKQENREPENVNLTTVVQETLEIFNTEVIRNNAKINTKLPEHPVWVFGDKIQLQQVMMNFLRNALNAMENTPPESRLINIEQITGKGMVTLSVHDAGPGIDQEIKDKIFKPFVTGNKKGFGLGLAICRSIIDKHHGEIWAENPPVGGAQFSFRLKIVKYA
jgi:signal transduction histidine kinase